MAGEIRKARSLGIKVYRLRITGEKEDLREMEVSEEELQICEDHISK